MKNTCIFKNIEDKILSKSRELLFDETRIQFVLGVFLIFVGAFILPVIRMIRFFVDSLKSCKGVETYEY